MNGIILSNIAATAAIAVVFLLRSFLKNKIFSKVFVLLWMLVIIRLLLPFEFSSGISLYVPEKEPVFEEKNSFSYSEEIFEKEDFVPEQIFETETFSEMSGAEKNEISSEKILLYIWLFGAVFVFAFFAAKHVFTVRKIMSQSVPFPEVPEEFKTKNIRYRKNKNLASPLSFGFLRPVAVLPENTTEKQLPFVLLHEYTHIKDGDAMLKMLALFSLSLNWFNPAVWAMIKFFHRDIERYCDERVLKKIGTERASSYAGTILDFAERESLSLSYFSAASLCERVASIMNNKKRKNSNIFVFLILTSVVLTMTACGTFPEEKNRISAENRELVELIENANWQKSNEYYDTLEIEKGELGSFIVSKDISDGKIQSYWDFSHLPVRRIIIKNLGIEKENREAIPCINSDINSSIVVSDYLKLLEQGFKIEYEQGDITISSEKPLDGTDFYMDIMADFEKIEVVSEDLEIEYLGFEPKQDFETLGYYGDEAPNNYLTESFEYESDYEIKTVSIENFGFSDPSFCDIYVYDSNEFFITVTYGDELRESGFNVSFLDEGNVVVSTAKENKNINEKFHMEIYMDFDSVDLQYENVTVTRVIPVEEFHTGAVVSEDEKVEVDMEFLWPTEEGYICSSFGSYKGHTGADILPEGGKGSEVYAAASGTVVKAKWNKTGYGNHIIIDHGNGIQTLYAHCEDLFVKTGQEVKAGETVASVGATGNSTGTHLHFEIRINGAYVNPEHYITQG